MAYFKPWTNWAIPIDMSPTYMPLTRERSEIPLITTLGFRSKRSSAELKGGSVLQHLHGYPQERGTDGANTQASPEETSWMEEETLHLPTEYRSSSYSPNKPMRAVSMMINLSIPTFEKHPGKGTHRTK